LIFELDATKITAGESKLKEGMAKQTPAQSKKKKGEQGDKSKKSKKK
jgi:hypothetical protein